MKTFNNIILTHSWIVLFLFSLHFFLLSCSWNGSLQWLDSQSIIQSLVTLLDPKVDKDKHYNVAQLLCDFIKIARDNQRNSTERNDPDPLLNTLES